MTTQKARRGRPALNTIFKEFSACKETLIEYGGLPSLDDAAAIWDDIWFVEAHNSTGIEGNTLLLKEVKAVLTTGKSLGKKKIAEYLEVIGYGNAAKWVYGQAKAPKSFAPKNDSISLTEIRYIHSELLSPVWEVAPHKDAYDTETPGNFRQHDINPFDAGMTPPSFTDIEPQITDFINNTNKTAKSIIKEKVATTDIPLELAKIHCGFEKIHPFLDGNGRTGRLILNLILVRLGYPPCIILKTRRTRYINAMENADNGKYKQLAETIARGVLDNVHRFIIPKQMKNKSMVTLESLVDKTLTYSALRQAALRGRLNAIVGDDGKYYSTKEAVKLYKEMKYKK